MLRIFIGFCSVVLALLLPVGTIPAQQPGTQGEATSPPDLNPWLQQPAMLVFSKTLGWRHNEGIAGGDAFFVELARRHKFGIYTKVDPAIFNPSDLAKFEVVVFNNMTGDTLNEAQEAAFENWLQNGGGWIGLHSAGDASQDSWPGIRKH